MKASFKEWSRLLEVFAFSATDDVDPSLEATTEEISKAGMLNDVSNYSGDTDVAGGISGTDSIGEDTPISD